MKGELKHGEIIKGGGFELVNKYPHYGSGCASWPCWEMDVGDLWIVPNGEEYKAAQTSIHTHARNVLGGAKKFKTRTINNQLHVWRIK